MEKLQAYLQMGTKSKNSITHLCFKIRLFLNVAFTQRSEILYKHDLITY